MPSMTRNEFLSWRDRQVRQATEYAKQNPDLIVAQVEGDDEIVCDVCNCTVESEVIFFNDWGLYCPECQVKYKV